MMAALGDDDIKKSLYLISTKIVATRIPIIIMMLDIRNSQVVGERHLHGQANEKAATTQAQVKPTLPINIDHTELKFCELSIKQKTKNTSTTSRLKGQYGMFQVQRRSAPRELQQTHPVLEHAGPLSTRTGLFADFKQTVTMTLHVIYCGFEQEYEQSV